MHAFHPSVQTWFRETLGEPSPPQVRGWPAIASGAHTLIAAPTGSGKTLAAFLFALDQLLSQGDALADETRVLYVSPLKALGNDVQKNLAGPLAELRERDPSLPEVRVFVRSGDTPPSQRAAMTKRPPHVVVTTPESLYILLTSDGGRRVLSTVRTVIVDEIHAVLGDKRGSHLALSLERLDALVRANGGALQRIGLSATQKPLADVGRFLVGAGRECTLIDEGHLRTLDLALEIPDSPLEAICSHETWAEIYARIAELIEQHRTTLIFVTTRKLSERVGAELSKLCGERAIACHHSSLSKERRLDAEQRLKAGHLRALVATASLELGIDIGDVDLVVQVGTTRSIAAFLQRVGRSGHGVGRTPKGRLFPLTPDELVEGAALLRAVRGGRLDRTPQPSAPLDILAQQAVAACVPEDWSEDELFETLRRAWPYRELARERFDACLALHSVQASGRGGLLSRDSVGARVRATKRARITALTSGGAIPDTTQYRVLLEPEGVMVGQVDEDFAIESSAGDIFQLGNTSWRVLKVESGAMRVADAQGAPPSLPFWVGEAPARTRELSREIADIRENGVDDGWFEAEGDLEADAILSLRSYLRAGRDALGAIPTQTCIVLERFFDEAGGMQLVLHAPFGGRTNRALGLALRKKFCRSFGFELQAAANEDAIVLSLGPQHSFDLDEVLGYLSPASAQRTLTQALLAAPFFQTRWRWNITRSLLLERSRGGKRTPAPILRMRADDLLAAAFPAVMACGETLPAGDIEIPEGHPIVDQTIHDCLHEVMDLDGLIEVLEGLAAGEIRVVTIDTPEPSPFARAILTSRPYGFLDDAPLEERRTQAVLSRRLLDPRTADELAQLDPKAIARVRAEAWPDPESAEELHEALSWMGFLAQDEVGDWLPWLETLAAAGRVVREGQRWFALEATRDEAQVLRGRMEALGPVHSDDPLMRVLEGQGHVLKVRFDGRDGWCDRRLLARIQRATLETLRREIEPVSAADYLRFLGAWQHVAPGHRLSGPRGVAEVVRQLAGYEAPSAAWEKRILAARITGYLPEWLDQLAFSGEVAWGRLWGSSRAALRSTPVCLVPRADLGAWLGLSSEPDEPATWPAQKLLETLEERGATFPAELEAASELLPSDFERGAEELIALGWITSDSFASVRQLLLSSQRRARQRPVMAGRWSLLRKDLPASPPVEHVARTLLARWGVVFRRVLERERQPIPWRDLVRALRALELRGEVRGGRFVARFAGEQFALPEAVPLLRKIRREGLPQVEGESEMPLQVAAADPLNLRGILTPDERVSSSARQYVPLV